jgi:hypothetical protein
VLDASPSISPALDDELGKPSFAIGSLDMISQWPLGCLTMYQAADVIMLSRWMPVNFSRLDLSLWVVDPSLDLNCSASHDLIFL